MQRWHRGRGFVVAVGLVVAGSALVACTSDDGADRPRGRAAASTTAAAGGPQVVTHDDWSLPVGEEVPVPTPPLGSTAGTITPIDGGFVLYGGTVPPPGVALDDPQIFDPATGTWTVTPPVPFDLPLYRPEVAGVPGGFVVMGQACSGESPGVPEASGIPACTPGSTRLARYDVADGTWTEIDVPERFQTDDTSYSLRLRVESHLVDGQGRALVGVPGAPVLLDLDAGTWTDVEPPPDALLSRPACATDAGIVAPTTPVPGLTGDPDDVSSTDRYAAAVLADDGTWERVPFGLDPKPVPAETAVSCTDRSVLFVTLDRDGQPLGAHEFVVADRTWREVATPPMAPDPYGTVRQADGVLILGPYDDAAVNGPVLASRFVTGSGTWEQVELHGAWPGIDRHGVFVGRPYRDGEPQKGDLVARRLYERP